MKLVDFKKQLKKTGVPYSLIEERFDPGFNGSATLSNAIRRSRPFSRCLANLFRWGSTPEGFYFWDKVSEGKRVEHLAEAGEYVEYPIFREGRNLQVGCQTITPKQQLAMFKLLGKQLGYEIEG